MASNTDRNALERVFSSHEGQWKYLLEQLRRYLDTAPGERSYAPNCSRKMAQSMQKLTKEVITHTELAGVKVLLDFLLYWSEFPSNGRGLDQLIIYNTIPGMLSDIARCLAGCQKECNQVIASLVTTMMSLCEYSDKLAGDLRHIIPLLLSVAVNNSCYSFTVRIDCVRVLNVLLEACGNPYKVSIKTTLVKYNSKLASLLTLAGDYELQVALVECLFRTTTAAERVPLAQQWFSSQDVIKCFLGIREADFEQDCRQFLNTLNYYLSKCNKATVFSLPCRQVLLGDIKLHAPQDMKQLWMDFNTVSRSLSVFVSDPSQEEDIWESITVKRVNISEHQITATTRGHLLQLTVNCPLSVLTSFPCTAKGDTLQAILSTDPSRPLQQLLEGSSKTSIVMTPVQLGSTDKLATSRTQKGPKEMSSNVQTPDKMEDVSCSPIDPMGTPVVNSSTGSVCTPTDQSIPVKTPRTSTPSLKHIINSKRAVDQSGKKAPDDQISDYKNLGQKSKVTLDQQNKATLDRRSKATLDRRSKATFHQQSKAITDQKSKTAILDQKKKLISDQKSTVVNDQTSKVISNQRDKGILDQKSKDQHHKVTSQKKTKPTDHKNKMATKPLSDLTNKRPVDKSSSTDHNLPKKPPLTVTANNIDSFIDQIVVKPKVIVKKYSTRSTVKQSNTNKSAVSKNIQPKKLPAKTAAALQKSYKPVSPVVKLQQKRSREMREAITKPTNDLSTFDFDDDDDVQPPIKKSRQINSSTNSSCSSSVDMSISRVNNQKSFDMVPQKKGKKGNKKQRPVNRKPITTPRTTSRTEIDVVLESQDMTSPPLDGQTSTTVRCSPTISSYNSPKSDTTYEPPTTTVTTPASKHYSPVQTPVTTTATWQSSPAGVSQQPSPQLDSPVQQDSPVVMTQQSSPIIATQQVSPAVGTRSPSPVSGDVSLAYSQPSTPEEDHVIMRGFQEVCQELISGAGGWSNIDKPSHQTTKCDNHDPPYCDDTKKPDKTTRKISSSKPKKDDVAAKPNKEKPASSKDKSTAAKKAQEVGREQRNKRRRQSTGEVEVTPIISPPAKRPSMIRQLDLRVTKTPTTKAPKSVIDNDNTDVDGYNESTGKLDHVTPDPTPFGSPTYQPMQNDVTEMLGNFGSKISQVMKSKRNHYDQVLQGASKASNQLLTSVWSEQYKKRHAVLQSYHQQTMEELHNLEEDIKATQQVEEQAMHNFKHYQKILSDSISLQTQKLTKVRMTQANFHQDMETLENNQTKQQGNIHQQLAKEMRKIQDEILNTNKQQELRMVKQSLQAMLLKL